jgi:hypothetical protein
MFEWYGTYLVQDHRCSDETGKHEEYSLESRGRRRRGLGSTRLQGDSFASTLYGLRVNSLRVLIDGSVLELVCPLADFALSHDQLGLVGLQVR